MTEMRATVEQAKEQASTFGNLDRITRFRAIMEALA